MHTKKDLVDDKMIFESIEGKRKPYLESFRRILQQIRYPFAKRNNIGIKLHWGEKGNKGFLPPDYAREIVESLKAQNFQPFIFDTTVLYSGGRRTAQDSLQTAASHGYIPEFLGCPIIIADGMDSRNVISLSANYKHFEKVEVGNVFDNTHGFVILSHFKGHMVSCFGGAIKNLSMGFASRAQKQRMHSDYHPVLNKKQCTRCGICAQVCPTKAAVTKGAEYPEYDLDKCIGCAQCIAMCPELALEVSWDTDIVAFQEKLVETAAAVWNKIKGKTILINALINISAECDCLPGKNPFIAPDYGFVGGYHPVELDAQSLKIIGADIFEKITPIFHGRDNFPTPRKSALRMTIFQQ